MHLFFLLSLKDAKESSARRVTKNLVSDVDNDDGLRLCYCMACGAFSAVMGKSCNRLCVRFFSRPFWFSDKRLSELKTRKTDGSLALPDGCLKSEKLEEGEVKIIKRYVRSHPSSLCVFSSSDWCLLQGKGGRETVAFKLQKMPSSRRLQKLRVVHTFKVHIHHEKLVD